MITKNHGAPCTRLVELFIFIGLRYDLRLEGHLHRWMESIIRPCFARDLGLLLNLSPRRQCMSRFSGISIFLAAATVLAAFVLLSAIPFVAHATISTGSLQGTITDPQGAVLSGARVIVTNRGTGQKLEFTTSGTGAFATGALSPGDY